MRVRPKTKTIPRTRAQRDAMLQAAAQRRREETQAQRVRHLKNQNTRLENDVDRLEQDVVRARIAGATPDPDSSAMIDRVFQMLLERVIRELAIKMMNNTAMTDYFYAYINHAARLLASERGMVSVLDTQAHGQLVRHVSECLFEGGIELEVTVPSLTIKHNVPRHAILCRMW